MNDSDRVHEVLPRVRLPQDLQSPSEDMSKYSAVVSFLSKGNGDFSKGDIPMGDLFPDDTAS